MSLKKCIGLVSMAVLGGVIAMGCSSKDDSNGNNAGDAATTPDTGPKKDAGNTTPTDDASTDDGGTDECKAVPVPNFTATWTPPNPHKAACSPSQLARRKLCFDATTQADATKYCTSFEDPKGADFACGSCIVTDVKAKTAGAVVLNGQILHLNQAGCFAVAEGNLTDKSCGAKYAAFDQCGDLSCASCPQATNEDLKALGQCAQGTATTECKTQADAADACLSALDEAGTLADCDLSAATTFGEAATILANVFCGGAPEADAGKD